MKARRKSDGKIIEVIEHQSWNKEVIYVCNGTFYRTSELDFNTNEADTVISGWVARDDSGSLNVFDEEPTRDEKLGMWSDGLDHFGLPYSSFPDLTWDRGPQECEIIIKRKKE